jgi:hypothetical protein
VKIESTEMGPDIWLLPEYGRVRIAPSWLSQSAHEKNNQENYDNCSCQTVT